MSVRDLLKQLSQESDVLEDDSESTVEDIVEQSPVAEMVLHAHQAEEVAEQLNELAEKAEEVAEQDKEYLVNELSTEMMHMCYRNIMTSAGLDSKAHSFESNYDHLGKTRGLAVDARQSAQQMSRLHDSILDFSPEGKLRSFFRFDKRRISSSFKQLKETADKVRFKGDSKVDAGDPFNNIHYDVSAISFRDNKAVTDLSSELLKDIRLILDSKSTIDDNIKRVIEFGNKIARGSTSPTPPTMKLPPMFGVPLLGNRQVDDKSSSSNTFTESSYNNSFTSAMSDGEVFVYAFAMTLLGPIGSVINVYKSMKHGNKTKKQLEDSGLHMKFSEFDKIVSEFDKLKSVLERADGVEDKIEAQIKEIKDQKLPNGKSAAAVMRSVYGQLYQQQEMVYEHAFYLLTKSSNVFENMAK